MRGYGSGADDGDISSTGPRIGQWEHYDTTTDPGETTNLAAQHPEQVRSLTRFFETWSAHVGVVPREEIVNLMKSSMRSSTRLQAVSLPWQLSTG